MSFPLLSQYVLLTHSIFQSVYGLYGFFEAFSEFSVVMSLRYRYGDATDLAAVYQLNRETFPESWSLEGLKGALKGGYELLLCMNGTNLTGYLLSHDVLDEVHIMQVAVAPSYRRRGIAEQLSRNLLAAKQGVALLLEVRASNLAAQSLYEKLGFVHSGVRKAYYVAKDAGEAREDAVLMNYQRKNPSTS